MRLLGLLAVLWGVCVAGAPLQRARSFPGPQDVYNSLEAEGGTAVLVPNAAVKAGGTPLGAAQPGLATPEACASACRAQPNCTWFQYCQSLVRLLHDSQQEVTGGAWYGLGVNAPRCRAAAQHPRV
jgi:hypothetical protein